jgi:hypothetical protein
MPEKRTLTADIQSNKIYKKELLNILLFVKTNEQGNPSICG